VIEEVDRNDPGPGEAGVGLRVAVYWVEERRTFSGTVWCLLTPFFIPSVLSFLELSCVHTHHHTHARLGSELLSTPPGR